MKYLFAILFSIFAILPAMSDESGTTTSAALPPAGQGPISLRGDPLDYYEARMPEDGYSEAQWDFINTMSNAWGEAETHYRLARSRGMYWVSDALGFWCLYDLTHTSSSWEEALQMGLLVYSAGKTAKLYCDDGLGRPDSLSQRVHTQEQSAQVLADIANRFRLVEGRHAEMEKKLWAARSIEELQQISTAIFAGHGGALK